MPDAAVIVYTRYTDTFQSVAWQWAFYNAFDIQAQLTALEVEAKAKGAAIAVNVALIYPEPLDEGQNTEEDKDNGKEE